MRHLYRCFDETGRLLYVGTTWDVEGRMTQHRAATWWSWMVDRVEVVNYPTDEAAHTAEREAIASENPRFNILGRWQSRRGWSADDYRDFYDASRLGPSSYTSRSQARIARVRDECLNRYGIDLAELTKETA